MFGYARKYPHLKPRIFPFLVRTATAVAATTDARAAAAVAKNPPSGAIFLRCNFMIPSFRHRRLFLAKKERKGSFEDSSIPRNKGRQRQNAFLLSSMDTSERK